MSLPGMNAPIRIMLSALFAGIVSAAAVSAYIGMQTGNAQAVPAPVPPSPVRL